MSVDIKDFRRFKEGQTAQEDAVRQAEKPLLPQEEALAHLTGYPELDKVVRVLQANIEAAEEHLNKLAHVVLVQVDPNTKLKMTLEYMLAKGMLEAYKAIQLLPAQIVSESKGIIH